MCSDKWHTVWIFVKILLERQNKKQTKKLQTKAKEMNTVKEMKVFMK